MASLRPAQLREASYVRTRESENSLLQSHPQGPRNRSTSRNPNPYSVGRQRHYGPDESRSRKPPQSPKIEDAGDGDDGVQMRGKLDQQPVIMDIASESGSSDGGSGIFTPDESSTDNQNSHAQKAKETAASAEHFPDDGALKTTTNVRNTPEHGARERGRREMSRLDTEGARNLCLGRQQIRMERERSPYAYSPRQPKSRDGQSSGGYLMSPEAKSPQLRRDGENKSRSQRPHIDSRHNSGISSDDGGDCPRRLGHPTTDRRASEIPQIESPFSKKQSIRAGYNSSEGTDLGNSSRRQSGRIPPVLDTRPSASFFENQRSSQHTPLSPEYTRSTLFNRESLLNGATLENLTSMLEAHHPNERKASPRVSPAASPYTSPYPSPPETPPQVPRSRANPINNWKGDSSVSRPSSPLTSGSSPLKATAPSSGARRLDQESDSWRPALRSRATSPLPSARIREPELTAGPKIDVRSPSPMPSRRERPYPSESYEAHSSRSSQHASFGSLVIPTSSTAQALRPTGRQRSSSNVDISHASRPSLTVNPTVSDQDTRSPRSPISRYTPQTYLSTPTDSSCRTSQYSHNDLRSPASRSRSSSLLASSAYEQISASATSDFDHRSRKPSVSRHNPNTHRSRSSLPNTDMPHRINPSTLTSHVAVSDESDPSSLPLCPRPDPVAHYDDWYALEHYHDFAICPDCRHNVFGTGFERHFLHQSDLSRKKTRCALNDPWVRLACLITFRKQVRSVRLLEDLAVTAKEEKACPESSPADERSWYHLNDPETGQEFSDFQVCSHCVYSLEGIFRELGKMFHWSRSLKDEPRVCALRSEPVRFETYLNRLVEMGEEAQRLDQAPDTSDFIWEVKRMTVISPCSGDQVLWGQDWHIHPELPELTVCEECYLTAVRPAIKSRSREAAKISGQSHEVKDGVSCKLFSSRMKQIFLQACKSEDHHELKRAVKKRNELQQDLIKAQEDVQRYPRDRELQDHLDELRQKWAKLAKRHE